MRNSTRRPLDLIVFMAVLATGVLLIALGVPANSLATLGVALSGLYNAWTGVARAPPSPPTIANPPTTADVPGRFRSPATDRVACRRRPCAALHRVQGAIGSAQGPIMRLLHFGASSFLKPTTRNRPTSDALPT